MAYPHPNPSPAPRRGRRAFTLTEVLVIVTIIILVIAMAVPLFNVFSASRSVDGAENVISAALQRARAKAIGLQDHRGLFIFTDPFTGNAAMVTVAVYPPPATPAGAAPFINFEYDSAGKPLADIEPLPSGVGVAFFGSPNPSVAAAAQQPGEWRPLGLFMFDAYGRVEQIAYQINKGGDLATRTGLGDASVTGSMSQLSSQVAMTVFEKRVFAEVSPTTDPTKTLTFDATQAAWLKGDTATAGNSLALFVNRYNGTVFRAE